MNFAKFLRKIFSIECIWTTSSWKISRTVHSKPKYRFNNWGHEIDQVVFGRKSININEQNSTI